MSSHKRTGRSEWSSGFGTPFQGKPPSVFPQDQLGKCSHRLLPSRLAISVPCAQTLIILSHSVLPRNRASQLWTHFNQRWSLGIQDQQQGPFLLAQSKFKNQIHMSLETDNAKPSSHSLSCAQKPIRYKQAVQYLKYLQWFSSCVLPIQRQVFRHCDNFRSLCLQQHW